MKKLLTISLVLIMLLNNITVIADDLIDNANETPVVETTEATSEVEKEEIITQEETKEEITVKKEEIVEEKTLEEKTITSTPKTKLKAAPETEQYVVTVKVYSNNKLVLTDTLRSVDDGFPELPGDLPFTYLYGDIYGEYKSGKATVNGVETYFYCFDGENATIFRKDFQDITYDDEVVYYLYFETDDYVEETVYGNVELRFRDQNGKPVSGYEVTFFGQPGNVKVTGTSNEEGKLIVNGQMDVKLRWTYEVEGRSGYIVVFDENNFFDADFGVVVPEEEPEETDINGKINVYVNEGKTDEVDILTRNSIDTIKEGKINYTFNTSDTYDFDKGNISVNGENEKTITYNEENKTFTFDGYTDIKAGDTVEVNLYFKNKVQKEFKITVEHQINVEQINVNNGYSDKETSVLIKGTELTVKAGEKISYNDLVNPVNKEFTINSDNTITYNGDTYRLSGKFAEGGNGSAFTGSVHDLDLTRGSTFVMPNTDIHIIENYLIVVPEYTVTINYIDMDTNKAFVREDTFVYPDGSKQQDYTPVVKEFTGSTNALGKKEYDVTDLSKEGKWFRSYPDYEFVKAEGEFTGEMNEDKVINMYYKKLEGKVIVHYIDIEDNTLLDDVILTGKVGETYLTKEEAIENFELVKVEGDYTGTYTKDDIEVTYIYTAIGTGGEEVPEENNVNPQTSDGIKNNIISLVMSMNALALTLYLLKKNH